MHRRIPASIHRNKVDGEYIVNRHLLNKFTRYRFHDLNINFDNGRK